MVHSTPARFADRFNSGISRLEDSMTDRLFVYGSLAPGRPNAHVLARVPGSWQAATVRGILRQEGWGAAIGYPGIVLDECGDEIAGFVFSSEELGAHWARLDRFEGDGYRRVLVPARLESGAVVQAYLYALGKNDLRSDRSGES